MHAIDESSDETARAAAARQALLGIDLNLLLALHALLSTSSVTEASRRMHRTQSATSHALRRLREVLGDDLLVPSGRGLTRSARGDALLGEVEVALEAARRVFVASASFDPATTERGVTLCCPDLLVPLLPDVLASLRAEAPRLEVRLELPRPDLDAALARGEVDLAIGAESGADRAGQMRARLGQVHFVAVARAGHPALRSKKLTLAAWLAHKHVTVRTGSASPNLIEQALERASIRRQVGLVAPSFLAALHLLGSTDDFLAAPELAVAPLIGALGLAMRPLPVALPAVSVASFWHERAHRDPGHRWLRERLGAILVERLGDRGRRRRRRS